MAEPQETIEALNHPQRREILKYYVEQVAALSPAQVAKALVADASATTYHVHVLEDVGALKLVNERPVLGTTEHFYIYDEAFHPGVMGAQRPGSSGTARGGWGQRMNARVDDISQLPPEQGRAGSRKRPSRRSPLRAPCPVHLPSH